MKKILLILFTILCIQISKAQDASDPVPEEQIYKQDEVDVKPEFPGGIDAFYKLFQKSFVVPDLPGLVEKVVLSFTIEKDGTLNDIRIVHDAGFGTADQAIKILEGFPKWLPGKLKGKEIRTAYILPIAIRIISHNFHQSN